ncbi:MAG: tetratricopeptide repeat protein [Candidatus Competibacteraceae bacterium]
MAAYDVFISYRRTDSDRIEPLKQALEQRGLKLWFDRQEIDAFEDFSQRIQAGLAHAKALFAWYSIRYPESRACQWELTTAYLAAQREGDPCRRVLVVNPEPGLDHIHPGELRRENLPAAPAADDTAGPAKLADAIVQHLASLSGALGDIRPFSPPACHGRTLLPAANFVGRYTDLWQVHTVLHTGSDAIITAAAPAVSAQVQGMGGIGKSLLAEEYALRFGSAYPGGIFWLRALGKDSGLDGAELGQLDAERQRQEGEFARELGLAVEGRSPEEIRALLQHELGKRAEPFLWVVDDLPSGLDADAFRRWLAPHPLGKTLFTTRSREYGRLGKTVALDVLPEAEALELLTTYRKPATAEDQSAARTIAVDLLGCHPLALEVAAAALREFAGLKSFAEYRDDLTDPQQDELELAREFVDVLPTGHETGIAATLLRSIRQLDRAGLDFLLLAASLAAAPIPARLVVDAFTITDGPGNKLSRWTAKIFNKIFRRSPKPQLTSDDAERKAAGAFRQVDKLSLVRLAHAEQGVRTVHALVARTVRFESAWSERREVLRRAAVTALDQVMPQAADIRQHARILLDIPHARELTRTVEDSETADLLGWVARYDRERGDYRSAAELRGRQWEANRRLRGDEHPATLSSMNNLAVTLWAQGDLAGARTLQEQVLALRRQVLGEEHPNTLTSVNNLAATRRAQGDLAGARTLHEQELALSRRVLGEAHPDTLISMNNLAETLREQGDLAGERALEEQELALSRRVLGEAHPDTLISMNNLAVTLRAQGDLAGARALQEQVLALHRRVLGEAHPATLSSMNNLAVTLREQGDLAGARALQEQVLALRRRVLGEAHPATLTSMNNLAVTLRAQGDLAGARALHEQVLALSRRVLGEAHPATLRSMNNLAVTLGAQGELMGERALEEQVLEIYRRVLGEHHPDTTVSAWNLRFTLLQLGDEAAAATVTRDHLLWLLDAAPDSLSGDQRWIRERLIDLFKEQTGVGPSG